MAQLEHIEAIEKRLWSSADTLRANSYYASNGNYVWISYFYSYLNEQGCAPVPAPQRNRRSIRLPGYDYSQAGAYFVTVCTQNRECLFGEIVDGNMRLNDAGRMVADEWIKTAAIRDEIELDEWVVMPNHFHGILVITDGRGDRRVAPMNGTMVSGEQGDRRVAPTGPQPRSVGAVMAGFKSAVTKRINELRQTPGAKLWQRNYWEHVVRNESELNRIREYIHNNPAHWELDKLHPSPMYGHGAPCPNAIREPITVYGMEAWMV